MFDLEERKYNKFVNMVNTVDLTDWWSVYDVYRLIHNNEKRSIRNNSSKEYTALLQDLQNTLLTNAKACGTIIINK